MIAGIDIPRATAIIVAREAPHGEIRKRVRRRWDEVVLRIPLALILAVIITHRHGDLQGIRGEEPRGWVGLAIWTEGASA